MTDDNLSWAQTNRLVDLKCSMQTRPEKLKSHLEVWSTTRHFNWFLTLQFTTLDCWSTCGWQSVRNWSVVLNFFQSLLAITREPNISVTHNSIRNSMKSHYLSKEKVSNMQHIYGLATWNAMFHLGKCILDNKNGSCFLTVHVKHLLRCMRDCNSLYNPSILVPTLCCLKVLLWVLPLRFLS